METTPSPKLQPRGSKWWENARERMIKERDEMQKRQNSKFLYKDVELSDSEESDGEDLLNALEEVKEVPGILPFLKWLLTKFEEALNQRKLNSKNEHGNFCFSQPSEWKELLEDCSIDKFLTILEVETSYGTPKTWCIPEKIFDFGLKYNSSLIQDAIDEIIMQNSWMCKICKNEYTSVPQHLSKSKPCKENYTESDLQDLKHAQKLKKKKNNEECYQRDKKHRAEQYQERKGELAQQYLAKREEKTQKMAEYYQEKRQTFQRKNAKYYSKNREDILKKKAEQYKAKKKTD